MSERIHLHDLSWELCGYAAGEGKAAGAAHNAAGPDWFSTPFPATVKQAHEAAGRVLPEDWEKREWWYRCQFQRPGGKDRVVRLLVAGADYRATTFLNGEPLGESKGPYGPVTFDVSAALTDENTLAICVHPINETEERTMTPSRHPLRWETEGYPSLNDCGVWDEVTLSVSGPLYYEGWLLYGETQGDHGDLTLRLDINNTRQPSQATVRVRVDGNGLAPLEEEFAVELATGLSQQEFSLVIPGARSWYPHTQGEPVLYHVRAELAVGGGVLDAFDQQVGLRSIKLARTGEEENLWRVTVNGRQLPLRGVSWAALPLPVGAPIEKTLEALAGSGINAIRVWGGRHRRAFYDACDRLGILVLQEFPFGLMDGKVFPREAPDFPQAKEIVRAARSDNNALARYLRNHPSIFVWVGGTRLHNQDNAHVMRTIEEALRMADGTRPYVPTLPNAGSLLDTNIYLDGLSPESYEEAPPLRIAHGLPAWANEPPEELPARWKKFGGTAAQARSLAWSAGAHRYAGTAGAFLGEVRDWLPEGGFGLYDFGGEARPALAVLQGLYAGTAAGLSFDWKRYEKGTLEVEVWGVSDQGASQLGARLWVEDAQGNRTPETEVKGALTGGRGVLGDVLLTLQGTPPFTAYVQAEGGRAVPYPLDAAKPPSSYTLAEVAGVRERLQLQTPKPRFLRDFGIIGLLPVETLLRGFFALRLAVGL